MDKRNKLFMMWLLIIRSTPLIYMYSIIVDDLSVIFLSPFFTFFILPPFVNILLLYLEWKLYYKIILVSLLIDLLSLLTGWSWYISSSVDISEYLPMLIILTLYLPSISHLSYVEWQNDG